jgi:hypothetical protein
MDDLHDVESPTTGTKMEAPEKSIRICFSLTSIVLWSTIFCMTLFFGFIRLLDITAGIFNKLKLWWCRLINQTNQQQISSIIKVAPPSRHKIKCK